MANESATRRAIDAATLARVRQRQAQAAEPAWLHGEVARRMAERLPIFKQSPSVLVEWWSHAGASHALLRRAYPKARIVRVEPAARLSAVPPRWWDRLRGAGGPPIDAESLPADAAQLVWANMMLHTQADPGALLQQWRRALCTAGFLMFSTLGPDTLKTLREIYRDAGWGVPHAPFVDMHDLGDMLVGAGFADPVMDQELLRLTWPTPAALLAELRTLGGNAAPARHAGLRTPRWRARLEAALAARADSDGRIALEFEIVYGHAFVPPPRVAARGETRLSPEDLQRMARRGRGHGSER